MVAVHAFVTSKLDFCSALLYSLLKYQLQRLQSVQNTVARVVCQMSRFQHITPILQELHWQPINYLNIFKILFLVNKSLNRIKHSCSFFKHYMKFRSLTPSQFLRALKMFLFTKYIYNRQSFFWLASVLFFFFNQFEF